MAALLGPSIGRRPTAAYDRIVRTVAWLVILGASVVVAVSGLWRDTQAGILVVLARPGFMVLLVHDIMPAAILGRDKFVLEGMLAITLVTADRHRPGRNPARSSSPIR